MRQAYNGCTAPFEGVSLRDDWTPNTRTCSHRIDDLLAWELAAQQTGAPAYDKLLGRYGRMLAREVLRLRAQPAAA